MSSRVIPLGSIRRTYAERLVAVGDRAGEVKATSGGGIHYGMFCAEAAAGALVRADERGRGCA